MAACHSPKGDNPLCRIAEADCWTVTDGTLKFDLSVMV